LDSAEYYIKRSKNNDSYYSRADYENLMSKLEEKRGNYRQSLIHCRNYALLLDTTESAIRKRKSRLKNDRLQADGFETLEEYIESI